MTQSTDIDYEAMSAAAWEKARPRIGRSPGFRQSPETRAKMSARVRAWNAVPENREKAKLSIVKSYAEGALARRKVCWTPEMDAALISFHRTQKYIWLRTEGAKKIGVSDWAIRQRMKQLDLHVVRTDLAAVRELHAEIRRLRAKVATLEARNARP